MLASWRATSVLPTPVGPEKRNEPMGFSGWQVEVKKNRRGALLSPPTLSAGDLVGVRLSRANLAERVVPGAARGHLGDGTLQTVQVPLLEPAGAGE